VTVSSGSELMATILSGNARVRQPRLFDAIRAGSSETALVAGWAGTPRPGSPSLDTQEEQTAGGRCRLISAECPLSSRSAHPPAWPRTALKVKGFGCRPVVTYPRVMRAGVRSLPGRNPRGPGDSLQSMGI
jgi:hypothetical protein